MPTVYVHLSALLLAAPVPGAPSGPAAPDPVAPGSADALGHLSEAGFDIVVITAADATLPGAFASLPSLERVPDPLEAAAWYLTGETNAAADRPRGGRTMLVGPRPPAGPVPPPRFDATARDMASAAIAILAREAMR
jgi:hypothetical protein